MTIANVITSIVVMFITQCDSNIKMTTELAQRLLRGVSFPWRRESRLLKQSHILDPRIREDDRKR